MSTFVQFSRGMNPVSPSTISVGDVQWACLGGPCDGQISPLAAKNMLPLARLYAWDFVEGKPQIIDWSATTDWYEWAFHWRGWIPRGAMGGSIIPRPSQSMLPHNPMLGTLKGTDVLPEATIHVAHKLNILRTKLKSLLPDLHTLMIPVPAEVDCLMVGRSCKTSKELMLVLCRFCYGLLDLVGFF